MTEWVGWDTVDYEHITKTIAGLLRDASEDLPSEAMLARLCAAAVELLGVDGAGVMVTQQGRNWFAQAVSEAARDLEMVQETMRFGPCQDAASTGTRVLIDGAAQMGAWPRFCEVAVTFGITGVAALPLMSRGKCWGVLDLYTSRAGAWDDETLGVAQLLADGATAHLRMVADKEAARVAQVQLAHHTTHDDLTGLSNRLQLFDHLQDLLDRSASAGELVAVLQVNLQDFSRINSAYGHRAGDHVLREVGHRLNLLCSPHGIAARLSNDVFVIAKALQSSDSGSNTSDGATDLANRVHQLINEPIELESATITPAARIGVATCGTGLSAEEAVDEADNALFDAPEEGPRPTGVREFHSPLPRPGDVFACDLPHAVERQALAVYYQPVVSARPPHRIVGAEALLRWISPSGRVMPAQNFVVAATRQGLLPAFGRWMLNEVCAQIAAWDGEFDRAVPEVFINLSARELNDPTLAGALSSALDRHDLSADRIGIEIIEEALIHRGLLHRIAELRARGHRIAVDDFGTGYSTLARLTQFEVDLIKLDRSLTATLARDARRADFITAAVDLGHAVGAQVVAEGVETRTQRDSLMESGADRFQGYLFGHPEPGSLWRRRLQLPADSYTIHHVLSEQCATVLLDDVGDTLRAWFPDRSSDVDNAIHTLAADLQEGSSTRRTQNYLGIELTRSII